MCLKRLCWETSWLFPLRWLHTTYYLYREFLILFFPSSSSHCPTHPKQELRIQTENFHLFFNFIPMSTQYSFAACPVRPGETAHLTVVKSVTKYFLCYVFVSILVHLGKGYQDSYWAMVKLFCWEQGVSWELPPQLYALLLFWGIFSYPHFQCRPAIILGHVVHVWSTPSRGMQCMFSVWSFLITTPLELKHLPLWPVIWAKQTSFKR